MKTLVHLLIFLLFYAQSNAQQIPGAEIGVKGQLGFVIPHHTVMQYLVQGHAQMGEIYIEKLASGKKNWHRIYNHPEIGMALNVGNMGNKEALGYGITLIPYMKLHMIKKEKFQFNARLGAGIGYLSESFDRLENNKNVAIGSSVNVTASLQFEPEWKLKHFDIGCGFSFLHYSNGAFKMPNLGINIPSMSFHLGYKFNTLPMNIRTEAPTGEWKTIHRWDVHLTFGIKEIFPTGGAKFPVYNLAATHRRMFSEKSNFLLGADINYNGAYHSSVNRVTIGEVSKISTVRIGFTAGFGLTMDEFMMFIQQGIYALNIHEYDGWFYHRLGGRYTFNEHYNINLSLKTHFAKADSFELGFGYVF